MARIKQSASNKLTMSHRTVSSNKQAAEHSWIKHKRTRCAKQTSNIVNTTGFDVHTQAARKPSYHVTESVGHRRLENRTYMGR